MFLSKSISALAPGAKLVVFPVGVEVQSALRLWLLKWKTPSLLCAISATLSSRLQAYSSALNAALVSSVDTCLPSLWERKSFSTLSAVSCVIINT